MDHDPGYEPCLLRESIPHNLFILGPEKNKGFSGTDIVY